MNLRLAALLVVLVLFAALRFSPGLTAQELQRPAGWQGRFDRADASDSTLYFVAMPPGWHITTGPAGILYDPALAAEGAYRVRAEVFLFPSERTEGLGVFVGGRDLDAASLSYTAFVIRGDGRFQVRRRVSGETLELTPWTKHPAIVEHDGGDGTAKNVLSLEAAEEEVTFLVNGEEVARLPRSKVGADGIVGLRVDDGLNLHVTELTVEPQRE